MALPLLNLRLFYLPLSRGAQLQRRLAPEHECRFAASGSPAALAAPLQRGDGHQHKVYANREWEWGYREEDRPGGAILTASKAAWLMRPAGGQLLWP